MNGSLERLEEFVAGDPTVQVSLASSSANAGEYDFQRIEMSATLADQFRKVARSTLSGISTDYRVVEFSPGYRLNSDEVFVLHWGDADEVRRVANQLDEPHALPPYNRDLPFIRHLKFFAVSLQAEGSQAVLIRSYSRTKILGQSNKFAAFFTGEVFDVVEESALVFDDRIDIVIWEDQVFILSDAQFRRLFKVAEVLRQKTEEAVAEMHARFPIANLGEFLDACLKQPQMMSKALQIPGKDYFQNLTVPDVRRVIEEFELPLEVAMNDGQEELVFERAVTKRWLILKVLDDDYLDSTMTDLRYEVNSKLQV